MRLSGSVAAVPRTLFQSTHPSGVRLSFALGFIQPPNFNPRTPVGCDLREAARIEINSTFQSTHPSGVRRDESWPRKSGSYYFNPRTPVGCDIRASSSVRISDYFNPRTPVGCDPRAFRPRIRCRIFQSTHPSGVRQDGCPITRTHMIFQSTHPSGVRRSHAGRARIGEYFNPRTPVGCDDMLHRFFDDRDISIHAPQWGATRPSGRWSTSRRFQSTHPSGVRLDLDAPALDPENFNPRTPVGCDGGQNLLQNLPTLFQSTHPSGVRLTECGMMNISTDFNPRTPVGCDPRGTRHHRRDRGISIHAPQWGATRVLALHKLNIEISIHAPQWGATIPALL